MYSLLLKDFYILMNNFKAFILMILVFAFAFIPASGILSFTIAAGVMSGMMVVTTFSYDERAKWHRYALIMPLRRSQIVLSKFILLTCCTLVGISLASLFSLVAAALNHIFNLSLSFELSTYWLSLLTGFSLSLIYGAVSIALLFKYGAEKARMLMIISFLLPSLIGYGLFQMLNYQGVVVTDQLVYAVVLFSPIIALVWTLPFYGLSMSIFKNQSSI